MRKGIILQCIFRLFLSFFFPNADVSNTRERHTSTKQSSSNEKWIVFWENSYFYIKTKNSFNESNEIRRSVVLNVYRVLFSVTHTADRDRFSFCSSCRVNDFQVCGNLKCCWCHPKPRALIKLNWLHRKRKFKSKGIVVDMMLSWRCRHLIGM